MPEATEALEQLRRLRLRNYLQPIVSEDEHDEVARVFDVPADAIRYLEAFGFRLVPYEQSQRPIITAGQRRGFATDDWFSLRPYLCMAVVAEGYPALELDAWSRFDDLFASDRFSSYGFKMLGRAKVPGWYAGRLARHGAGVRTILRLWSNGVDIEYAEAMFDA
jgi:hypothetical protein